MQAEQMMFSFDSSGNLILPAAHSPGFVSGSTGWSLLNDGSAEFNNVTIRGGTVVSGKALYYDGTPALGNLIISLSAAAGTDAFGNTYPKGIGVKNSGNISMYNSAGNLTVLCGGADGSIITQNGTAHFNLKLINGQLILAIDSDYANGGVLQSNTKGTIFLKSGLIPTVTTDQSQVLLNSGNGGQTTGSGLNPIVDITDDLATSDVDVNVSGSLIKADKAGNSETWHVVGAAGQPAYTASWAGLTNFNAVTPVDAMKFRKDVENNTQIFGCFTVTGAGAGATVFMLPAGYYDTNTQTPFMVLEKTAAGVFQVGLGYVSTAGNFHIDLAQNFTRNAGDQFFVGAPSPIGNLP